MWKGASDPIVSQTNAHKLKYSTSTYLKKPNSLSPWNNMEVLMCLFVGQLRSHDWTDRVEFRYFTPFQDGNPHSDVPNDLLSIISF